MTKKAPKIPLNEVMRAIDKKDRGWYTKLSQEQKKAFSAWMMMRYASCVRGNMAADYLYMVNETVNNRFSDVSKHPELQWLLFTVAGCGKPQNHEYIKPPNTRKKKNKVFNAMSELFPHLKSDEVELMLNINTKDELKQFATDSGMPDKEVKEIFK
tara:strand:- start:7567 stop:8034 length:468 start_codon:yes stop_codon:yes gene_type:complete